MENSSFQGRDFLAHGLSYFVIYLAGKEKESVPRKKELLGKMFGK